jgi:hypothetical protein
MDSAWGYRTGLIGVLLPYDSLSDYDVTPPKDSEITGIVFENVVVTGLSV